MGDRFGRFLLDNPKGVKWSFSFRINGLPYNWTDGRAAWEDPVYTIEKPCLAKNDFSVDINFNPLKPMDVGNGMKFVLVDDATGYMRKLFAPNYGHTTRLTAKVGNAATDTTLPVQSSSAFTVGELVYLGSTETCEITDIPDTTSLVVDRAKLHTLRRVHNPMDVVVGPLVSSSPRVFSSRVAELWIGAVNEITGQLRDQFMIWSGVIGKVAAEGTSYTVDCDSLSTVVSEGWPAYLAKGILAVGDSASQSKKVFRLSTGDEILTMTYTYGPTYMTIHAPLLHRDTFGSTEELGTATRELTPQELFQDILLSIAAYKPVGSTYDMKVSVTNLVGRVSYKLRNRSDFSVQIDRSSGLGAFLENVGCEPYMFDIESRPGENTWFEIYRQAAFAAVELSATSDEIPIMVENAKVPFDPTQYDVGETFPSGYAKITSGDTFEIVRFRGLTTFASNPRLNLLTGVLRGQLGTSPVRWNSEEYEYGSITVEQVAVFGPTSDYGWPVTDLLLMILTSTGDLLQNSIYDKHGDEAAIGLNIRYLDIDSFVGLRGVDMLPINQLWIDKAGDGKKVLEEVMKAAGVAFTTRRFERAGESLFGLALAPIAMPTKTAYSASVGDADRLINSKVVVDYNERLIVNAVSLDAPVSSMSMSKDTQVNFWYAEDSIADYGREETLALKPQALLGSSRARDGLGRNPYDVWELNTAEGGYIAGRWFAAFAQGNYTVKIELPFTGWRVQVGDIVKVSLTGVNAPDGTENLYNVAGRVHNVSMSFGSRTSCIVRIRLAYEDLYELVPAARVQVHSSGTITLYDNEFSNPEDVPPFGAVQPTKDVHWFDRRQFDADIPVAIYVEGDMSLIGSYTITATDTDAGTVVLNANLAAGIAAYLSNTNYRVIMTYDVYDYTASVDPAMHFAYIGDNTLPSSTGKNYV